MSIPTQQHIINGEFVPPSSGQYIDLIDPVSGQVAGKAAAGNAADVDAAVAAAAEAFKTWKNTPTSERAGIIARMALVLGANLEELLTLEAACTGLGVTRLKGFDIPAVMQFIQIFAEGLESYPFVEYPPVRLAPEAHDVRVVKQPLGVCGLITAWNGPLFLAFLKMLPAIAAGNTVVIKPSPFTPLSTIRLVEVMNEVLPAGVVNVVTSDDQLNNIGGAMSAHTGIRKMVFTGSIATGKKVMTSAAETMKRLTLELGGNDAGIVLPDVDPQAIAEGLFWGAFINNGQTCAAMKRLYVHESVYDAVCEALTAYAAQVPVGVGTDEASILGPIANRMQFDKVKRLVDDAKAKGRRVLLGGEAGEGLFFPPTLIADMQPDDPLVVEEQFGPALPILKYSDINEALRMANASDNGLGGSVWSSDVAKAKALARQLQCGSAWVNKHGAIQPNAPFCGVKSSGLGVEFGEEGLAEYTDIQVVFS